MKQIPLTADEINDLLSACTFTRREYKSVTGHSSPKFFKALSRIEEKLWTALRAERKANA